LPLSLLTLELRTLIQTSKALGECVRAAKALNENVDITKLEDELVASVFEAGESEMV